MKNYLNITAAIGLTSIFATNANAFNTPYVGVVTGFVNPAIQAGGNCVSYMVDPDGGGVQIHYVFNTTDTSLNSTGRMKAMDNAAEGHVHVVIKQAQDVSMNAFFNAVQCQAAGGTPSYFATPMFIGPAN